MGTAPRSASATERRSAENAVRALISRFSPAHARLVGSVRRALRGRMPTAYELVYEYRAWFVISFSPSDRGYEGVLAIRGSADGVKLYFNPGKGLTDPEKLLRGAGLTRFIEIEGTATLARPAVARLIDEAIARHRTAFAPGGPGAVIVRSSSADEGPRRAKKKATPRKNKSANRP